MMTCRWNRDTKQREVDDGEPCEASHCRCCRNVHVDGIDTCPECLAEIRGNLREIARMCDSLSEETEHRGVHGEAMMLLGPAADPEARGHLEASVLAGRVPSDYLERANGELHPLFVLGTWDMVVRDGLEHDEPAERLTVATAASYLDRQLTYLAGYPYLPIEEMAKDFEACRIHLESVLRDGEQVEKGAPCLRCTRLMVKTTSAKGAVSYECDTCHRTVPEAQYRYAVAVAYRAHADRLPLSDMAERTGVPASTLRRWASKQRVMVDGEFVEQPPRLIACGKSSDGRKVYRVETVLALCGEIRQEPA